MRQAGLPNLLRVRPRTLPFERQSLLNLALHVLLGRLDAQEERGASYASWADVVAAQARRRQARSQARWRQARRQQAQRQQDQDQPVEKATAVKRVFWRRVTPRKTIFCETLQLNRSLSCHWQRLTKGTANRSVSQKELHSVSQKELHSVSQKELPSVSQKELKRLTQGTAQRLTKGAAQRLTKGTAQRLTKGTAASHRLKQRQTLRYEVRRTLFTYRGAVVPTAWMREAELSKSF
jgi:hypothetical protein